MFLSLLNSEQKKMFFSLAYNLAASDGDVSENEKKIISSYSIEMGMEFIIEEVDRELVRVINRISSICEEREKKIIIFEIIGLAMADCNYDEGEREIVKTALSVFGLDASFGDYCEKKLSEYFILQEELNAKILS